VTIVDRHCLEGVSCEGYATIKTALDEVVATPRLDEPALSVYMQASRAHCRTGSPEAATIPAVATGFPHRTATGIAFCDLPRSSWRRR
jgi:hypothetical protein